MVVRWEYLGDHFAPLPEDVLRGTELVLGVRFPSNYRECVRVNHGAYPSPNQIAIELDGEEWRGRLGLLLTLDPRAPEGLFRALQVLSSEHGLPPEIVPIADDGGGDFVCLDYRDDPTRSSPRIVYWHHELQGVDGLMPLAESFSELLAKLRPSAQCAG